jgi:hypothetical protein
MKQRFEIKDKVCLLDRFAYPRYFGKVGEINHFEQISIYDVKYFVIWSGGDCCGYYENELVLVTDRFYCDFQERINERMK